MFSERLTWVVARRMRLNGTPSHPRDPGGHDLLLEPPGLGFLILVDLALESLNLACPFSETDRVGLGYIVCPSTSGSVHEEEERRWSSGGGWRADVRFPTCSERSNLVAIDHFRPPPASMVLLWDRCTPYHLHPLVPSRRDSSVVNRG